jgi:hypothetical protein
MRAAFKAENLNERHHSEEVEALYNKTQKLKNWLRNWII